MPNSSAGGRSGYAAGSHRSSHGPAQSNSSDEERAVAKSSYQSETKNDDDLACSEEAPEVDFGAPIHDQIL